jgi:hypothetical protein
MSDSQVPPLWGPAYDERDLDALLSGETGSTPAALQPVESTLAALRAAGTGRELSDETAARAAFRAFAPAPLTTGPLPWTAGAEPAAVTSHTLVLPPADGRPQPAARHRHRRPAARSARKPRIAVTGAAAAALVVVAVVAGALTGSIGELTSFGRQAAGASASARATGQSPSQGTLVTGAASERPQNPKPTASASPAAPRPTSGPGSLCRGYFGYPERPGPGDDAAWITLQGQLGKLAGGPSPVKIYGYCFPYLGNPLDRKSWWPTAGAPVGGPGTTGRADTGNPSLGAGSQGNQPSGTTDQGQGADPGAGVSPP